MMICIRMMTDQLIDEDMRSDVIVRVVVGKESGMNMHTIRYYTREQSFTLALWLSLHTTHTIYKSYKIITSKMEETGPASAQTNPFTQFYGTLLHQGNMLQDTVRTGTYQRAVNENPQDFKDKVVLDVGTGSGILSFFAAAAGAKRVYAVEMSDAANIAEQLASANGYGDVVKVLRGKIEEVDIPEKVDVIISEPIGFLLVHERMLESYVTARDKFLKPGGKMYPSLGSMVFAPITDDSLYKEQLAKIEFWSNQNFFGIDLSSTAGAANVEYFSQPVVGTFPSSNLLSQYRTVCISINAMSCSIIFIFVLRVYHCIHFCKLV